MSARTCFYLTLLGLGLALAAGFCIARCLSPGLSSQTEAAVRANAQRRAVDHAAQRAPDSLANYRAGQRAENARLLPLLHHRDDSLAALRFPVYLPAVPPTEP